MIVRPMELKDLDAVLALERDSFHEPWTEQHFRYELNENPYGFTFIAEQEGIILGFINFWIMFEQATINQIAVVPKFRHKGIGATLIIDALGRMKKAGVSQINLEVRVSNKIAQDFHQKFEFKEALKKSRYYHDGEDALLMVRAL
jgi:ribosomal-protein-alanine N-acetyltransferase